MWWKEATSAIPLENPFWELGEVGNALGIRQTCGLPGKMQSDIVMTTHSPLLQSTRLRKSTTGKITGRVMRRGSGWEEIQDQ